jgi:hypothetical protein
MCRARFGKQYIVGDFMPTSTKVSTAALYTCLIGDAQNSPNRSEHDHEGQRFPLLFVGADDFLLRIRKLVILHSCSMLCDALCAVARGEFHHRPFKLAILMICS